MRQSCNNDGHQQSDNNNHHHVGCKIIYFEFKTSEASLSISRGGLLLPAMTVKKGKTARIMYMYTGASCAKIRSLDIWWWCYLRW